MSDLKSTLSVLVPVPVTDAILTSSTALEADFPVWLSTKTYAVGDKCIHIGTHRIYECTAAGNLNKDPTDPANLAGTTIWWVDKAPTNKWAMFDDQVNTQTVYAAPLTVVLKPGVFNAVYFAGLDAETITVTVKDAPGGNVIYTQTSRLEASQPADYWEYYFSRFKPQTDFLVEQLDQYAGAELTVTLDRHSGSVKCGMLSLGDLKPLGATQYGAKAKPKTYSRISTDEFGKTSIKKRGTASDMSATAWISLSEANDVLQILRDIMGTPCACIGMNLPEYEGLRSFGLVDGEVSFDHPKDCQLSINVQGFI